MARTAPSNSRVGQALTGIGAAAVVALIGALPFLLVWAAGNPITGAAGWIRELSTDPGATLTTLWDTLSSRDDGGLFLHVLAGVGWVAALMAAWAWISFLLAFVVEFTAQLRAHRHGRIPRNPRVLPGMRVQQRAAAVLAAAIIGAVAAPTLASASVSMPSTFGQPAAAAAQHADTSTATTPARATSERQPAAPAATGYIEVPVQRGESLLDVAEQHGISPQRLAEANYGVTQPDGRALQHGSMRVYPGWTLRVPTAMRPAAATVSTAATVKATPERMVYEVARGDRLGDIAERFLGEGDRYPEIARDNPALERRDQRFPDHIERTWRITLPDDARDRGPREHATGSVVAGTRAEQPSQPPTGAGTERTGTPGGATSRPTDTPPTAAAAPTTAAPSSATASPAAPAAAPSMAAPSPAASRPASASPAVSPSATSTPGPSASASAASTPPAASTPASAPADAGDQGDTDDSSEADEAVVIGSLAGAGLLAALLLTGVLRRRRRQRQHRRPGRRLPHPRGGATERVLRVAEQPADVDRLDAALRSLTAALSERQQPLPDVAAAWIVDHTVTIVLTAPCADPPAPWVEDGSHWSLPADAALPAVDDQLAPLPTLVAVGSQPGRHLLLDLERLGSLTIAGDDERALALLRYLASELACNSWSDDVEVIIAGFPVDESELLVALNPDRVRAVTSINEAAARLRRRIAAVTAALNAAGSTDTLAGRITDVGEAWAPQVLLVANPGEGDLAALNDLGRELHVAGRCAVAVASTAAANSGSQHTATVDEDGGLHLTLASTETDVPFLRVDAAAAGLPVRELEPLAEIMTQARSTDMPATPPAPETETWAQDTDAAGAVLNLLTAPAAVDPEPAPDTWSESAEPTSAKGPVTTVHVDVAPAQRSATASDPIVALPRVGAVPAVVTAPRREVTAAIRQRRRQADPELDGDLRAWLDKDASRPRIAILGPVAVEAPGPAPDQRRRFHAEIITYLAQRGARGASGEQLSDALWPEQQVKDASRRVAITRARRWLGETSAGSPWLPEMGSDRLYRLEPGYLLDWHLFRRLRSRGESHGPAGVKDLRAALELVRGVPLDGAERAYAAGARNPFTWLPESDIYPGHVTSAIVDTAHQLAELYLDAGDTAGARWAVQRAWLADPHRGDDEPWHDLMRAAHADGHTAELRNLLGELMRARDAEVPEDLTPETYAWLRPLLPDLLGASTPVG